jgi:peptidoglycan hydrolase CwlO-like protein
VSAARARVRAVEAQLVQVQSNAAQGVSAYAAADSQVTALEGQIAENRRDLAKTKAEIRASQTELARRVINIYTNPPPSMMQVLVSTGSISSALDSYDMMRHIAVQDSRMVKGFVSAKSHLQALDASLHTDVAQAKTTRAQLGAQLAQLRSLAGQRSALLASATTDLSHAKASAAQLAALRAEQARAAAAARVHSTPSQVVGSTPSTPSGGGTQASAGSGSGSGGSTAGAGVPTGGLYAILTRIAQCESGGNPHAISPGGQYRGLFQFTYSTWAGVGGTGDPAQASVAEQYRRAAILYERDGIAPWPVCGA